MIEIKPNIQHQSSCPYCKAILKPDCIFWHGTHTCVKSICPKCHTDIIDDLEVGHAVMYPCQFDLAKPAFFGSEDAVKIWGEMFLQSLQNPRNEAIKISKEVFKPSKRVIILNCIDRLYGHCLLKLINATRHLNSSPDFGLVVIVQKILRWMVPEGVAEVWTVDISLQNGWCHYPSLNQFIYEESNRFDEIYVSKAHSHPSNFDISQFTGVPKYSFDAEKLKVTFVWREDRIWPNSFPARAMRKLSSKDSNFSLALQNWQVQQLFKQIQFRIPSASFTVTGLGTKTKFPKWIEDLRVNKFNADNERQVCQIYAESCLIVGVHGSNMLLPSAHAGMTIDLMPKERWGNFIQDILYQESDPRLAAFRYRCFPMHTKITDLAYIASTMIAGYSEFYSSMTADKLP